MTTAEALSFAIECIEDMHGSVTEECVHEADLALCTCRHSEAVEVLCDLLDLEVSE